MARIFSFLAAFLVLLLAPNSDAVFWPCNFENDMCGWTDSVGPNMTWLITNSTTIDPGHDHTCTVFNKKQEFPFHSKCGQWLTTLPVKEFNSKQNFVLYSRKLDGMKNDGCMTFYYHFFGLASASFVLQLNTNQTSFDATDLWAKYVPQGNRWAKAEVHVPKQSSSFYLIFNAHLNAKYHDVVGLDDITFLDSPCPPSGGTDFESTNPVWINDGVTIATGGTPISDHTTNTASGHMALSGAKNPSNLIAGASNLTAQFISSEASYCLKFYYQFIGSKTTQDTESYIEVNRTDLISFLMDTRITAQSIFTDDLENKWLLMSVTLPRDDKNSNYSVTIGMSTVGTTKIAVDDITVSDKSCPNLGDCDFESDWCGWTQSPFSAALWLRSDGANSQSFKESPRIDHTTHTENGWFAMVPNEYINGSLFATLKSPPFSPPQIGSQGTCFQFHYFARTIGKNESVITVRILDLTNYGSIVHSVSVNASNEEAEWRRFSMNYPSKMPRVFAIEISSNYNPGELLSDIAIDDLQNTYRCDANPDRGSTLAPSPVPRSEMKWNCDFETGFCGNWKFDANWKITSFYELDKLKSSSSPPRVDHTRNSHQGRYLLYLPKDEDGLNATTMIVSSINSTDISIKPHCFSFYYYDASEVLVTLDVIANHPAFVKTEKSIRPNSASRAWTRVRVDFKYNLIETNLTIVFHGGRGANASFAIDDILLLPGACKHMEDYVYTMDSLENMDLDRISPARGGIGELVKGNAPMEGAPKHDHSTGDGGYFLFMNQKFNYNTTYKSELSIDNLPRMDFHIQNSKRCLRFAYQVKGNANLAVFIDSVDSTYHSNPIFQTKANHTNWMIAQIDYVAFYDHKLSFFMTKPFDTSSFVALDDISLSYKCDRVVQCDFDDDVCSYNSDYNGYDDFTADFEFARFVAPPITPEWPGPGYDHTKQSYGGGYLYMTGYPSKASFRRTAQIETPIISTTTTPYQNACLSLFTFISKNDAEFNLNMRLFSRDNGTKLVNLLNLKNITETKWTRHYVEIDFKQLLVYEESVFILKGSTNDPNTVIAIDDIDYSTEPCSYKHQFKCKNGNTIDNDQVCNFHDDCGDNSDEIDCGSCNFEINLCGWQNDTDMFQSRAGGMWIRTAAGSPNAPSTDGKRNSNGHFLLLEKSIFSDPNYNFIRDASLTRAYNDYQHQFKDAFHSCYITYAAYVGSDHNRSRAYIEVWAGSDADSAVIKDRVPFDGTNEWSLNAAFVGGFPHSFVVFFKAREMSINETVALDEIEFHNCSFPAPIKSGDSCPDERPILCNTTRICITGADLCDFENNCGDNWDESYELCSPFLTPDLPISCAFEKSLDTCGMTAEYVPDTRFRWEVSRGSSFAFGRYHSPSADHTTKDQNGQFAKLSTGRSNLQKKAYLYSPMMTSDPLDACVVRFFYYVNGDFDADRNNEFSVFVQYADGNLGESKVLFASNNYLATWNKAHAQFQSTKPFRFVFAGELFDSKGSISLDDISYIDACYSSSAQYKSPSKHAHGTSAVLIIFLVLLTLVLIVVGFLINRKFQSGELSLSSVGNWFGSLRSRIGSKSTSFENPTLSK